MKDQTSPVVVDVVMESINIETDDEILKKAGEPQEAAGVESDNDSGFLNASNISLAENNVHCSDARDDSGNEEPDVPSWRLKIPPKYEELSEDEMMKIFTTLNEEIDDIPEDEKRQWAMEKMKRLLGHALPETLLHLLTGQFFPGDSGISIDEKPAWLDLEKFRRGQKFANDYSFGIAYAELISLMTMFCFDNGLKPLIMTGRSSTPYTAFKRYLSTGMRVRNWLSSDPWTAGTPAYNDLQAVRAMHAKVRKSVDALSSEEYARKTAINPAWSPALGMTRQDFQSTCPAPAPGQCPYTIIDKNPKLKKHQLSQIDMSLTQFAFCGLIALRPKYFGIHSATDADVDDFCYAWRCLGYLLGIEDYFNFCQGSLEEIRTRSRDFLDYWVKPNFRNIQPECEHMMRCAVEGLQYYLRGAVSYETCLLDLAEILNLHMPRIYASLSYSTWIKHNAARFFFDYGSRVPALVTAMNRKVDRAIEKAKKFSDEKHNQLKIKSACTLDSYYIDLQKKKRAEECE